MVFEGLNNVFVALLGYTNEGASFLFGNLVRPNVPVGPADGPFGPIAATETWANTGALFAFSVLPTIIFFSSLMTLLYYMGDHADLREGVRLGDAADDGHLGRGEPERGR
jgi:concentrative nucleoside transporter, CNT family